MKFLFILTFLILFQFFIPINSLEWCVYETMPKEKCAGADKRWCKGGELFLTENFCFCKILKIEGTKKLNCIATLYNQCSFDGFESSCWDGTFCSIKTQNCELNNINKECKNKQDCGKDQGLICVNKCQCDPTRTVFDEKTKTCKGKFNYPCINGQCSVINTKCYLNPDQYSGTCFCAENYKNSTSGDCLGDYSSKCSEKQPCHEDFECKDTSCKCKFDFQEYKEKNGKCFSKLHGKCVNDYDCVPNTICAFDKNGQQVKICQCKSGFLAFFNNKSCDPGHNQYCKIEDNIKCESRSKLKCNGNTCICEAFEEFDENSKMCKIKRGYPCNKDDICVGNLECGKTSKKCECTEGFYSESENSCKFDCSLDSDCNALTWPLGLTCQNRMCKCNLKHTTYVVNDPKKCAGKIGSPCILGRCSGNNASCLNGKCVCDENFKFSKTYGKCLIDFGSKCTNLNVCHEYFKCDGNVCNCLNKDQVHQKYQNESKCYIKASKQCSPSDICVLNASCNDSRICECLSGYLPNDNGKCQADFSIKCSSDEDCSSNKGLSCIGSKCNCQKHQIYQNSIKCLSKINEKCQKDADCVENAYCNIDIDKCECSLGYSPSINRICKSSYLTNCSKDEDCVQNKNLYCIDDKCNCKENHEFDKEAKKCLAVFESSCSEISECVGNLKCTLNNTCQCEKGAYNQTEQNCILESGEIPENFKNNNKIKPDLFYIGAGIGLGLLLLIVIIVISIFCIKRKKPEKKGEDIEMKVLSKKEVGEFKNGNPEKLKKQNANALGPENFEFFSYNKSYEISKNDLIYDETDLLGFGTYGKLYKGKLFTENANKIKTEKIVGIKVTEETKDKDLMKVLFKEIKTFLAIGKHANILQFIGSCTQYISYGTLYIINEFCEFESLDIFLKRNKKNYVGVQIDDQPINSKVNVITIAFADLIKWAYETSSGMEFLEKQRIIHGDLSARNILLTKDKVAKITEFSLPRMKYLCNLDTEQTKQTIWRWMALEVLKDLDFSSKSDMWSFGIVLWEIFSLAKLPYSGKLYDEKFIKNLESGEILECPDFATPQIYSRMKNCWKIDPKDRPNFSEMRAFFQNLFQNYDSSDYMLIE